jgi:fructokinase
MDGYPVAVIGEAVADAFPRAGGAGWPDVLELELRPGGGPANTAVALGRLGTPTRFLGRLAPTRVGQLLRDHVAASGVDLSGTVIAAHGTACLAIANVDAEGRTTYDFYLADATDWRWTEAELTLDRLGGAAALHAGSMTLVLPPGGERVEELLASARATGVTVSVDPNVRPGIASAQTYRVAMRRWAALADLVRLSDDDLAVLRPDGDFGAACEEWHAAGVRLVVLTRGPHGASASLAGTRIDVPAVPVAVVDTVGAGDSFTGALLHRLHREGHLAGHLATVTPDHVERALAFGVEVAARTVAVRGADPPWARDLVNG